ncbi:MAG: hypothetical protein K8L91_09375 [Anaerolineae bacterium]|nr:hypothetical protein [Anaerolineae bacterium]
MADITLRGTVLANGDIKVLDQYRLLEGQEVEIVVRPSTYAEQIEATKQWMAQEPTPEQQAHLDGFYAMLEETVIEDSGLPADYADELDHYLYGTPKRRSSSQK